MLFGRNSRVKGMTERRNGRRKDGRNEGKSDERKHIISNKDKKKRKDGRQEGCTDLCKKS